MKSEVVDGEASSHNYFMPMVDMLAGVVFILVILLAAVSLVSREDFTSAREMQGEIARIEAELKAARTAEEAYLEPRRQAQAAIRALLSRIEISLAADGIETRTDLQQRSITIFSPSNLVDNSSMHSQSGRALASAIAGILRSELPCMAEGIEVLAPEAEVCLATYGGVRLEQATIGAIMSEDEQRSDVAALALLTALAEAEPTLLALRAADSSRLMTYRGGVERAKSSDAGRMEIELTFQPDLPALP